MWLLDLWAEVTEMFSLEEHWKVKTPELSWPERDKKQEKWLIAGQSCDHIDCQTHLWSYQMDIDADVNAV